MVMSSPRKCLWIGRQTKVNALVGKDNKTIRFIQERAFSKYFTFQTAFSLLKLYDFSQFTPVDTFPLPSFSPNCLMLRIVCSAKKRRFDISLAAGCCSCCWWGGKHPPPLEGEVGRVQKRLEHMEENGGGQGVGELLTESAVGISAPK